MEITSHDKPTKEVRSMKSIANQIILNINQVTLGKEHQVKLALACLFDRSHLLKAFKISKL